MKSLLFIFLVLTSNALTAQDSPYKYFKIDNKAVIFEKVYDVEGSVLQIERLLTLNIPKIDKLSDYNKTNEIITAKIKGLEIDYRKYGGKWANTWLYVNHPMFADVVIVWKDKKYRVTVSNIRFVASETLVLGLSDGMTRKKGTEFTSKDIVITGAKYIESTLDKMFEMNNSEDSW